MKLLWRMRGGPLLLRRIKLRKIQKGRSFLNPDFWRPFDTPLSLRYHHLGKHPSGDTGPGLSGAATKFGHFEGSRVLDMKKFMVPKQDPNFEPKPPLKIELNQSAFEKQHVSFLQA